MSLAERLESVSNALRDEEKEVAHAYVQSFQQAGISSTVQLVEVATDASTETAVRDMACRLLAWLDVQSAVPALAQSLETGDDRFAWAAANALVRLRANDTAETILRVLEQGSPTKQAAAAWVLGWLGLESAIPSLRVAVVDESLTIDVRAHATEALGIMQAHQAVPDLVTILSSESAELRYWAAYALGQIGDPTSIPELERLASSDIAVLSDGRSVREEALEALDEIRSRESGGA